MEKNQNDRLIGIVLGSRFKINRLIGQGGMANVYLAMDMQNQAKVAVKVLKSEFFNDEEFVRRFDAEAKAASSLNHPNIVKVYGVGEEKGILYMVMQYVEGMTLKEMVDQYGRLDWHVAVPISVQIAKALENAHENGIVHRDIKPHNIMITRDHKALVTDFGIARASTANTITLTGGSAMGSVHYFSPEQARGAVVGAKADIYSLGILMYEMVTGRLPFDGDTSVSVAIMHLQEQAQEPARVLQTLPIGLSNIIMKCMRKNAAERYESAQELAQELQAFLQNPNGRYGVVQEVKSSSVSAAMPLIPPSNAGLKKIRDLEKSIYERRRKRRKESIIVFLLVILSLAVISIFFAYGLRRLSNNILTSSTEKDGKVIGNYVGRDYVAVSHELGAEEIPHETKYAFSEEFSEGQILEQSINQGRVVKEFALNPLVLTISKGSDSFTLDDYIGKAVIDVENFLRNEKNLDVEIELVTDDKVPQEHIIRTEPPAASIMRPGYKVKLVVSSGEKRMPVPNLANLKYAEAKQFLVENGFKLGTVTGAEEFPEEEWVVRTQSPEPGTSVKVGTTIDLVVDIRVSLHTQEGAEESKDELLPPFSFFGRKDSGENP